MTSQPFERLTNREIMDIAEQFGRDNDIYKDGTANLIDLVDRLGGQIVVDDGHGEYLEVGPNAGPQIFLSPFTSAVRDRFTIAHELGHYVLEHQRIDSAGDVDKVGATKTRYYRLSSDHPDYGRSEVQANIFASALLMPAAEFRAAMTLNAQDIVRVARKFGVSRAAATIRADVLRCI